MEKLQEIIDIGNVKILHEGKTKVGNTMTILAPWGQADEATKNGRTYSLSLLQREVNRVQKSVEAGSFIGSGDHNPSGQSTISDASHIIKKLWIDKDGKGMAELKIIPTVRGNAAMTLIKQGATLGLSTRGFGDVSPSGIVSDNYKLSGIDIVTNPSASVATFNQDNVFESVGFDEKEEHKMAKSTTIKQAITRAVNDVNDGKFSSIQEALIASGRGDLARGLRNDSRRVTPADVAWEALGAGVDPAEFAKKINESIDQEEAHKDTGWSKRERESILREVEHAGKDISSAEKRVKILREHKTIPTNDEDSFLEQEAQSLYEQFKAERPDDNVTLESVRNMLLKERKIQQEKKLKQDKIQFLVRENLLAGPKKKFD